jgi:hypothetical protein
VSAKGYVVRGKDGRAVADIDGEGTHWFGPEDGDAATKEYLHRHMRSALSTWFWATESGHDVRIFAVAENGTETPLPTYEEALAEVRRGREPVDEGVFRPHVEREAALASENATLRAEVEQLTKDRDRMRGVVIAVNDALFDVCHGDHEHQIECHADTLPAVHRRLATAAEHAFTILGETVFGMIDPEAP